MKNLTYPDIILAFSFMLFGVMLYAMLWAKVFIGDFRAVSFESEMVDILTLALLLTFLYAVWRSLAQGRARTLLVVGLCLTLSRVLVELPLDKYLLENPLSFVRDLFLISDAIGLLGIFIMLFGFNALYITRHIAEQ